MKSRKSFVSKSLFIITMLWLIGSFNTLLAQNTFMDYADQVFHYNQTQDSLPYRIFLPDLMREPIPLLLFLHGAGERGTENERQLIHVPDFLTTPAFQENHPCIILAPQCPVESYWAQVEKPSFMVNSRTVPSSAAAGLPLLLDQIISQYAVDTSRIYIAGLSMGAMGTLDLLARHPERFAAALAVCGAADTSMSHRYAHIPLRIFHGDADPVVPVEKSRELALKMSELKAQDFQYHEYPGMTHNTWDITFQKLDWFEWLYLHR